jgi:hypothetical protein
MEAGGQVHAPADLPQGRSPQYTLDRWLSGPQTLSRRCGVEPLAPAGNRTPTVQSVARRYTD